MRASLAVCSLILIVFSAVAAEAQTATPAALLQRGVASYRAGHYDDAVKDLSAAAAALLSPEQMQNYVNSGKFPSLDRFETALVYLALAESKLGHNDQARDAVLRLMTAERIDPTYAQLPLEPDAAGFEALAARLVPGTSLTPNAQLARGGTPPPAAAPPPAATTVAEAAPAAAATPVPPPPATATAPPVKTAEASAPPKQAAKPAEKLAVAPTIASERAERQKIIDDLVAKERAKIEKAADERIADERAAAQKAADERVAAERAASQKAADERVAAAQRDAEARIATERAAIQRAADERVAQAQKAAEAQVAAMQAQNRRSYLLSLRQADSYAANGRTDAANDLYTTIVNSSDAPREIIAEAAVGLYRTGAFRSAVAAFRKLAPYARGEEDLRYYNAVSLYETGDYDEAKKELACALPYLQVTDDVSRYRAKIENSPSRQAAR